jgi:hypothetical protein
LQLTYLITKIISSGMWHHVVQQKFTDILKEFWWTATILHSITYHEIVFFVVTAMRTPDSANYVICYAFTTTKSVTNFLVISVISWQEKSSALETISIQSLSGDGSIDDLRNNGLCSWMSKKIYELLAAGCYCYLQLLSFYTFL